MPDAMAAAAGDSIKALRRAAGELRDLDVMDEHLEKKRLPGPLKKITEDILDFDSASSQHISVH